MGTVRQDIEIGLQGDMDFDGTQRAEACKKLSWEDYNPKPIWEPVDPPRAVATRQPRTEDLRLIKAGVPQVSDFPVTDVTIEDLAFFLLPFFQKVTEGETPEFEKNFTFHDTEPDFKGDAGYLLHVISHHPETDYSVLAEGSIVKTLNVSISADTVGQRLSIGGTLLSRNIVDAEEPIMTPFTRAVQAFWTRKALKATNAHVQIDTETDLILYGLEFTADNGAMGIGCDANGLAEDFRIPDRNVTGTIRVGRDAKSEPLRTSWQTDDHILIELLWQSTAVWGASMADMRITMFVRIDDMPIDRSLGEVYEIAFTGIQSDTYDVLAWDVCDWQAVLPEFPAAA